MDERTFQMRLALLLEGIGQLPEPARVALARFIGGQASSNEQLSNYLGQVTDIFRLGLTYQLFDIEATRRENRYLRRILEDQAKARSEALDEELEGESFYGDLGGDDDGPGT